MTAATMSKAAYAKHRGVGKSAVSNWVKRGQIVLTDSGAVDVTASDALLDREVDPGRGRPATAPAAERVKPAEPPTVEQSAPADDLASIRARDLREKAIGQALKNAQLAGELVPVAAYEAKLQTMITGLCERMQAELRGMAERLALEGDQRVVRALLDDAVHAVRSDAAQRHMPAAEE